MDPRLPIPSTTFSDVVWTPQGHQATMVDDPDCARLTCIAVSRDSYCQPSAQAAFNALLARHSLLRSHYARTPSGSLVVVTPVQDFVQITMRDLTKHSIAQHPSLLQECELNILQEPLAIYRQPPVRCTVIRLGDRLTLFLVMLHHSVADAISINIVRHDLPFLYRSALRRTSPPLPAPIMEFRDFVRERSRWLEGSDSRPHRDYWHSVFSDAHNLFQLPYDRKPIGGTPYLRPHVVGGVSSTVLIRLRALAAERRTTIAIIFYALVLVALARWSARPDAATWICHSGRFRREHYQVVGCFFDHWLLRLDLSSAKHFGEVLKRVHRLTLTALPHLRVPLHYVAADLRRTATGPLYPGVVINFMSFLKAAGVRVPGDSMPSGSPGYGLSRDSLLGLIVNFYESADRIHWRILHSSHLFEESTIVKFSNGLADLAARVASNPLLPLADIGDGSLNGVSVP
jgi:hypothetical protein